MKTGKYRFRLWRSGFLLAASILLLAGAARAQELPQLPAANADLEQLSVSGMSSGAFMAVQFSVAFSKRVMGAGVVAGGPFYCASLFSPTPPATAALAQCMRPLGASGPKAADALAAARLLAQQKKIDPPVNIRRQRIYVFSGTADHVVESRVVKETADFYAKAGVEPARMRFINQISAGHAMITASPLDAPCDATREPFINNCGFPQAHDILKWIYGDLEPAAETTAGRLLAFDQRAFDPKGRAMLGPVGYLFVPTACRDGKCRLHVVFHGCDQSERQIGDRYARSTGYNEMASANRIIVLYPQARPSPRNPMGCWDFWGYISADDTIHPDYYSRQAPQLASVMAMVKQLGASPRP